MTLQSQLDRALEELKSVTSRLTTLEKEKAARHNANQNGFHATNRARYSLHHEAQGRVLGQTNETVAAFQFDMNAQAVTSSDSPSLTHPIDRNGTSPTYTRQTFRAASREEEAATDEVMGHLDSVVFEQESANAGQSNVHETATDAPVAASKEKSSVPANVVVAEAKRDNSSGHLVKMPAQVTDRDDAGGGILANASGPARGMQRRRRARVLEAVDPTISPEAIKYSPLQHKTSARASRRIHRETSLANDPSNDTETASSRIVVSHQIVASNEQAEELVEEDTAIPPALSSRPKRKIAMQGSIVESIKGSVQGSNTLDNATEKAVVKDQPRPIKKRKVSASESRETPKRGSTTEIKNLARVPASFRDGLRQRNPIGTDVDEISKKTIIEDAENANKNPKKLKGVNKNATVVDGNSKISVTTNDNTRASGTPSKISKLSPGKVFSEPFSKSPIVYSKSNDKDKRKKITSTPAPESEVTDEEDEENDSEGDSQPRDAAKGLLEQFKAH
ncbi:MAG: hypothetical protein M1820_007813 [Bogoriella megaspora]|nr:MAG: hypothetical protein M1820_007813 [Bogoriella megaspora]